MIFKDKYFFLSTFYISPISITIGDKECMFTNVEAAYQAQKVPEIADKFTQVKGLEAKRMEGKLKITHPDWENYKLYAMANALHAKFKNPLLLVQLKAIEGPILNENYWGDEYWGIYKGKGLNILGKMLMCIRESNNDLNVLYIYITDSLKNEL